MSDAELRERMLRQLRYDPDTGRLTWIGGQRCGKEAGGVNQEGYARLSFEGRFYSAHRLAWFLTHGAWPEGELDHINGVRNDNRIANLRIADRFTNAQNSSKARRDSSTGYLGVTVTRTGRFRAGIKANGTFHHLGTFATAGDAHEAYMAAKRRLHQGFVPNKDLPVSTSKKQLAQTKRYVDAFVETLLEQGHTPEILAELLTEHAGRLAIERALLSGSQP